MPADFDLFGQLPTRTTLLEASAGTGKTYAIAALTVRYLAEQDLDISQLLLITFNAHAASELRDRVRARLDHSIDQLRRAAAGELSATDADAVDRYLAGVPGALPRLERALDAFGEATISTTHGFCQLILEDLGILGDWNPDETVGPDDDALITQCASDTYLQMFAAEQNPAITPGEALVRGSAAASSTLPLLPDQGPYRDYAEQVRALYQGRKFVEGVCTFDDIVTRLRRVLRDSILGPLAKQRLGARYQVVLVDEFQDTDPDQWDIIEQAFVAPDRATVLIGDPKQSIYGFRGADLGSYLLARGGAEVLTLGTNFRSDQSMVDAVVELFGDAALGDESITVTPIAVPEAHAGSRLEVPGTARLWLRRASGDEVAPLLPAEAIERDLVHQVQNLLQRGTIEGAPVLPSDIAVLVRSGFRAQQIRDALTAAGLPAVLTGSQSVWGRPAAGYWRALLVGMKDATQTAIRLAALTPLIGSELDALLREGGAEPARVSALVRELGLALRLGGIGRVVTVLRTEASLEERLLGEPDGDQLLADLLQVAELLVSSRAATLPDLIAAIDLATSRYSDEASDAIRLASDSDSIRVMTVHAAKGLEFPVVLLPETDGIDPRRNRPFTLLEGTTRKLWIGPKPDWNDPRAKALNEQNLEEELRLLYVGLTRAKHFVIAWQVDSLGKGRGPLAHLLKRKGWRPNRQECRRISSVTGLLHDSGLDLGPVKPAPVAREAEQPLGLARLSRGVDKHWRRTSYSGLTAGLHDAPSGVTSDEPADFDLGAAPDADEALSAPSLMNGLPAGTGFGTLVHAVLELTDWSPHVLESSVAATVSELGPGAGLTRDEAVTLAEALVAVCRTPLAPLTQAALTDLPVASRLPELDFDLPLGDRGAPATLADLAALMNEHLPADDPLATYPARLAASQAAGEVLAGFLTGSIDAILRLPDGSFGVVDYKTNRLTPPGVEGTIGHYTRDAMAEAMMQAHYPLQAILYGVALHRFLSATLRDYDPASHLGGVGYLFVRGMAGPKTPEVDGTRCGVFTWFPPPTLTIAASDLLGGTHA